jgi:hypothetical protein
MSTAITAKVIGEDASAAIAPITEVINKPKLKQPAAVDQRLLRPYLKRIS